jgi:hypothetical protein
VSIRSRAWFVLPALAGMACGCHTAPPDTAAAATAAGASVPVQEQPSAHRPPLIEWAGAGDCLGQLRLLHELAAQGRLEEAHAPPFAVALATPASSLEWVRADAVPLIADLPLDSYEDQADAAAAAPCLLLVAQPGEVQTAHRVVDFQTVASEYQSGVRSEKNPDYDAAQARLREAERETKRRGSGILRVGDPLLDLVGLAVGGVIAAFDQVGSNDDVDDALASLKETPRSRDRPVYQAYEFERSTVRAGKEAAIGVALRDLRRDRMWRSEVRQTEMRQLAVLEGLDPRDRDYEQHRAGAMSREEFEHWQRQPPQLPISALVTALVEGGGTDKGPQLHDPELLAEALPAAPPIDWLGAARDAEKTAAGPLGITALAPGAGPDIGSARAEERPHVAWPLIGPRLAARPGPAVERTELAAALDPRLASVVRLEAGSRRGNGFYVRPRLVVTAADLVGSTSVIDVTTSQGESGLGLVVHTDAERNIALVHVPRVGRPALLSEAPGAWSGHTVDVLELIEPGQARLTRSVLEGSNGAAVLRLEPEAAAAATSMGAPVFLNDRAVALVARLEGAPEGNLVPIEALGALLESEALAALH